MNKLFRKMQNMSDLFIKFLAKIFKAILPKNVLLFPIKKSCFYDKDTKKSLVIGLVNTQHKGFSNKVPLPKL